MKERPSIHVRVPLTREEADALSAARERGDHSRAWLAAQILRGWLASSRRRLPVVQAGSLRGFSERERRQALERRRILDEWAVARINAIDRGESRERGTIELLAELAQRGKKISRGTLYIWSLRHQGFGLAGLVDRRGLRVARGTQKPGRGGTRANARTTKRP